MGIDISQLSPWAQQQIARKMAAQMREQEQKKRKYNNIPTKRASPEGTDIKFDSKREAARFDELMLLLNTSRISDLKLQPAFTLQEAYTTVEGKRVRAIVYRADFSYKDSDGKLVVEDVKSKATKTRVYAIKKKLMLERYGISIIEIE